MELLTSEIRNRLLENGRKQEPLKGTEKEIDFPPVVKLFFPASGATWLLTELSPNDPDIAFGLCDLGMGFPELGYVSLSEIEETDICGIKIERDLHFKPSMTISQYAKHAREHGGIVEQPAGRSR